MMTYCDKCVHKNVCENEDVDDPAMNYCKDRMLSCGDCVDRQILLSYYEYDEQMPAWFIESASSVQPTYEWISVESKLPDKRGQYLVTYHPCYFNNVGDDIVVGIDTFRGKTEWAKKKYQRVIAWMPLPQAYGKDKKE